MLDLLIGKKELNGINEESLTNIFIMLHSTMRRDNRSDYTIVLRHNQNDSGLVRRKSAEIFGPNEIFNFYVIMFNKPNSGKGTYLKNVVTLYTVLRKGNVRKSSPIPCLNENVLYDTFQKQESTVTFKNIPAAISAHVVTTILEWFYVEEEKVLHTFPGVGVGLQAYLFKESTTDVVCQHQEMLDKSRTSILSKIDAKEIDQVLPRRFILKSNHHLKAVMYDEEESDDEGSNDENESEQKDARDDGDDDDDDGESVKSIDTGIIFILICAHNKKKYLYYFLLGKKKPSMKVKTALSPSQVERQKRMERRRSSDPSPKCQNPSCQYPSIAPGDARFCRNCNKVFHTACMAVIISKKSGVMFCTKECQTTALGAPSSTP